MNKKLEIQELERAARQEQRERELEEFAIIVNDYFRMNAELLIRKHRDYGAKNISDSPGGALNGLRVRMHDKMARINNLIDHGVEPANESLRDSYIDLANYAMIALLVIDGEWGRG
jgi:hypothetical protein